jgi:hypothetical protein
MFQSRIIIVPHRYPTPELLLCLIDILPGYYWGAGVMLFFAELHHPILFQLLSAIPHLFNTHLVLECFSKKSIMRSITSL